MRYTTKYHTATQYSHPSITGLQVELLHELRVIREQMGLPGDPGSVPLGQGLPWRVGDSVE